MEFAVFAELVWARLMELVFAPLHDQSMLWAAAPLLIATIFITAYFGRHRKEELGWNSAFGNTMVFLFVAIGLIREMYYSGGAGSWDNLTSNPLYLWISAGLAATGTVLMAITYFHLLPKGIAFAAFSIVPLNVIVYVAMATVYAGAPLDAITAVAGISLVLMISASAMALQFLVGIVMGDDGEYGKSRVERLADMVEEELARRRAVTGRRKGEEARRRA